MRGFAGDLKFAMRRLAAAPLFTIFAVLSLAVGIGVTSAVYSVVESIFFRDLGLDNPEGIAFVVTPYDNRTMQGSISQPDFDDLRAVQTSFNAVSASAPIRPAVVLPSTTELVAAEAVDGTYFSSVGVQPLLGREIRPADDAGGESVVVLSHALWRDRFAASPSIVGTTVRISGRPFDVIGVMPESFAGIAGGLRTTRLWLPLSTEALLTTALAPARSASPRDRRRLLVFGRLKPGASTATATAELAAISANLDATYAPPSEQPRRASERQWRARSLADITADDVLFHRFGMTLVILVALVLVVACTNLANLVLARGTARQQDFTVRRALGASRWRLVRAQCAESVILAVAGGGAAYAVFNGLSVLMDTEFSLLMPMSVRLTLVIRPELSPATVAIAVACLLLSLMVFGLEPALQLTRTHDLRGELASEQVGNARKGRQHLLLRWQVTVAAGFFVVATMFVKYTIAEAQHDSGVDTGRLAIAAVNFGAQRWDEATVRRTVDIIVEHARKDPSVAAVSVSTGMPYGAPGFPVILSNPDRAAGDASDVHTGSGVAATPSIFSTLSVPIVHGRGFDERDHAAAAPVAVISELAARKVFGTSDVVGRRIVLQQRPGEGPTATIVGVSRDTDVGMSFLERRPFVYVPLSQRYDPYLIIAARSTGNAALAVAAVRQALRSSNPDLAVDMIDTGPSVLAGPMALLRAAGVSALALGVLTLALAMAGLFGIQSHIVARRTREIGVRMSFGATASQIKWMVLKDGYRPVVDGLVLGLAGGVAGRVIVRAYLDIDVNVIDPWMFVAVPVPLIGAAFGACYVPARRASAVEPTVALRHL
ncbi:MAG: ABC transporter permease [Planctomycetota bacterium]|nr:ABC transporter permease [Planctomycetota bacterium]